MEPTLCDLCRLTDIIHPPQILENNRGEQIEQDY